MKQKIKEALKTRAKNLGLDDSAFDGVAAFGETIVKEDADIEGFVGSEATMNLLKTYQSVADKARAAAKAKQELTSQPSEPATNPQPKQEPTPQPQDMAKIIADAVAAAIKPINDELAKFKGEQTAKAALETAKVQFFENDYVKKYGDEATDAWDIAMEIYKYNPEWTAEQINEAAMGRFNKAVAKKGVDTTKPFESDGGGSEPDLDMTKVMEIYRKSGRVAENKPQV